MQRKGKCRAFVWRLFVCTTPAGRRWLRPSAGCWRGEQLECFSAGTALKERISPDAVRLVRARYGIDMEASQRPKLLDELPPVDVVVTMGCNVACPNLPCRHREDWGLPDPTGQGDAAFRTVMYAIECRVLQLAARLDNRNGL